MGTFSSNTGDNPKEQVNAIYFKSEKEVGRQPRGMTELHKEVPPLELAELLENMQG